MRRTVQAAVPALVAAPFVAMVLATPCAGQPPEEDDPLRTIAGLLQAVELPKHALVIGNEHYVGLPEVTNALNDAQTMAAALKAVGFNVDAASDLGRDAFFSRLNDFVGRALALTAPEESAVVAFYFAGHGFRGGSENFLVPVDAPADDTGLPHQSISLSHIVEQIGDQRVALALFFVDACRTEFLGAELEADIGFVEPQGGAAESVYYGFASGFGQPSLSFVSSGDANSPFARVLAARLGAAGTELSHLFEDVRREVATITNRSQVPSAHKGDDFLGEHYFRPVPDYVTDLEEKLALALLKAELNGTSCFVRKFLDRYPTSPYSTSARSWLLLHGRMSSEDRQGCS
jgi:hypothetical protein